MFSYLDESLFMPSVSFILSVSILMRKNGMAIMDACLGTLIETILSISKLKKFIISRNKSLKMVLISVVEQRSNGASRNKDLRSV